MKITVFALLLGILPFMAGCPGHVVVEDEAGGDACNYC